MAQEISEQKEEGAGQGTLFGPEAVLMLFIAGILDVIGIILVFFFLDDFGVTDIMGIVTISVWILFRSQGIELTKGAGKTVAKVGKWGKRLKWLRPLCIIGEVIPYVGAAPLWLLLVYAELQE